MLNTSIHEVFHIPTVWKFSAEVFSHFVESVNVIILHSIQSLSTQKDYTFRISFFV